jgi:hypothetical protein
MTKDKETALLSLFRYNKTIDYYMEVNTSIWGLVTLGDLTWARPLALIRSGHLECQVSRSSYPAIDFLGSNWLYIIYLYNWAITVTGTKNVKTSNRSKWRILHYGRNTKTRAFLQTTGGKDEPYIVFKF